MAQKFSDDFQIFLVAAEMNERIICGESLFLENPADRFMADIRVSRARFAMNDAAGLAAASAVR